LAGIRNPSREPPCSVLSRTAVRPQRADIPGERRDGRGRDAAWLVSLGYDVIAVEPAAGMRAEGQCRHPDPRIRWLEDRLPDLTGVNRLGLAFDLIMLNAVWMHVPPPGRARAFRKLATLLKPGGTMLMNLRDVRAGPADVGRTAWRGRSIRPGARACSRTEARPNAVARLSSRCIRSPRQHQWRARSVEHTPCIFGGQQPRLAAFSRAQHDRLAHGARRGDKPKGP
jgi:SAM-dependent methyltransferase